MIVLVMMASMLFIFWCGYSSGYDSGWLAHFDASDPAPPAFTDREETPE